MANYAIIKNGVVDNVVVASEPDEGRVLLPDGAGIGWHYDGTSFTAPVQARPTLAVRKETLTADLAAQRLRAEEGGIDFSGSRIATDANSQLKITAAYLRATANPSYEIPDWKLPTGDWTTLDAATIIAVGDAVHDHVEACFSRERALAHDIQTAAVHAALDAIDITSGWP